MNNVREIWSIGAVKPFKDSKVVPINFPDPSLLMGVELEIERVYDEKLPAGFRSVEDGSLRNSGREFITQPMTYSVLHKALTEFFKLNTFDETSYSERTSIHVHCNCQDLTLSQLASLLLLYQVFERMLFLFVGGNRDKNIFCVPLYECALSYRAVSRLEAEDTRIVGDWSKYSALNLLPIGTQGTVEFRHMPGTNNMEKITKWLQLLGCLFAAARKYSLDEIKKLFVDLNTTSQYRKVTDTIFGEYASVWENHPYEALLEDGVLNMKYSLIKQKPPSFVRFDTAATEDNIRAARDRLRAWNPEPINEWRRAAPLVVEDWPEAQPNTPRNPFVVHARQRAQVIMDDLQPEVEGNTL